MRCQYGDEFRKNFCVIVHLQREIPLEFLDGDGLEPAATPGASPGAQ